MMPTTRTPTGPIGAAALVPIARRSGMAAVMAAYDRGLQVEAVRS